MLAYRACYGNAYITGSVSDSTDFKLGQHTQTVARRRDNELDAKIMLAFQFFQLGANQLPACQAAGMRNKKLLDMRNIYP
jgi:hypothetical protein